MNSSSATKVSTSLVFSEPTLFLMISPRPFEDRAAAVTGFAKKNGPAERKGVRIGWVLAAVDRIDTLQKTFAATLALYRSARRPVELKFVRDPDYSLVVGEPPTDLKFEPAIEECIVAPFHSEPGPAGGSMLGARLKVGDYVMGINTTNTSRMSAANVVKLLHAAPRPMELRFGREGHKQQLVAAAIFDAGPMGLLLRPKGSRVRFIMFHGVGTVERSGLVAPGHVLIGINDVAVKSLAHAHELLNGPLPLELRFRKMDVYMEGGWASPTSILVSRVRVLFDFPGSQPDDLPVQQGDFVDVLERTGDFWQAKRSDGRVGWIPSSYVMPLSALEQNRPEYVVSVLKKSDERRSLLAQQAKQLVEVATSPQQSFDRGKHHSATATAAALGLDDRHQSDEPREISSEGSDLDAIPDDERQSEEHDAGQDEEEDGEYEMIHAATPPGLSVEQAKFRVIEQTHEDFPQGDLVFGLAAPAKGAVLVKNLRSRIEAQLPLNSLQNLSMGGSAEGRVGSGGGNGDDEEEDLGLGNW